jgi:hypothetical protein
VWGSPNDIFGQHLRTHGFGGSIQNVGGGCGSGGTTVFGGSPAIGVAGFRCLLVAPPPGAVATIFNFSVPTTTIPCGSCVWTPFSVTSTPPLAGPYVVEFTIPCVASLVGSMFETQWTTIDPSQAPCPQFPGIVLSDRNVLTIGQ